MAVKDPIKVKGATITSADVKSFDAGLDERGDYNIAPNSYSYGRNVMVNSSGNVTKRLGLKKWLPNTVGFSSEISTVYYNDHVYYFVADDGKVKYCQENDTAWTDCGGSNAITTTSGVITTFLRANDWLLCMNGTDSLRYIDLATFNMTQFTYVATPTSTLTCAATGISGSGSFNVYYAITYNSNGGGETAIGPIKTQAVSKSRSVWKTDGTEYLTVTFNDTPPSGATSRNLYAAVSLVGTSPVASDLVMLKANIPLGTASFVDNGSIPFDISYNFPPENNTTAGIKASLGTIMDKTPILYGDPDNPYDVVFGVLSDTGVSFGNESQRLPLLKGTNYYPTSVIGFRNNQGIPSIFALFSGTDGVSKQQTISKKTVTYGNNTISYWEPDELNAGASAVYSKYAVINYLGQLVFPSSDGITSIKTEQQLQNVLASTIASEKISKSYRTIKSTNFDKIVGTAWNNLLVFTVPSRGYNYNNQLFVYDLTNKDKPKWSIWDIAVDWVGAVSPPDRDSFLYVRQGNKIFKLIETYVAEDEDDTGASSPFPLGVEGSLLAFNQARNSYFALAQAVFYVANFIGTINITVTYIKKKGRVKTKTKTFTNGSQSRNVLGGWSNPRLLYQAFNNRIINWSTPTPISSESNNSLKAVKRLPVRLPNPVVNEVKFKISSNLENTSFDLVGVTYEGVNVGIVGDIV